MRKKVSIFPKWTVTSEFKFRAQHLQAQDYWAHKKKFVYLKICLKTPLKTKKNSRVTNGPLGSTEMIHLQEMEIGKLENLTENEAFVPNQLEFKLILSEMDLLKSLILTKQLASGVLIKNKLMILNVPILQSDSVVHNMNMVPIAQKKVISTGHFQGLNFKFLQFLTDFTKFWVLWNFFWKHHFFFFFSKTISFSK